MAYPYDTYQNPDEVKRLQELGQQAPAGVDIVGPTDEVTPQERQIYFPKGQPAPQHQGALAELAFSGSESQQQGLGAKNAPESTPAPLRASQQAQASKGQPAAMMQTTDPVGYGKVARQRGEAVGVAGVANFVADVVKLIAGGYAGGAAAAGGGAGAASAGAAEGASTGGGAAAPAASSGGGSSFGSDFAAGFKGDSSASGWGGYLGKYARGQVTGGGGSSAMGGEGGGGAGGGYEAGMTGGTPGSRVQAGTRYLQGRKAEAIDFLSGNYMSPTGGGYWSQSG